MAEIIPFKGRTRVLPPTTALKCGNCQSNMFMLLPIGHVHCAGCGRPMPMSWEPQPGSLV